MAQHENVNESELERRGKRSDARGRRGPRITPLEMSVLLGVCALFGVMLSGLKRWEHWDPPLWLQTLLIGLVVTCVMLWIQRRRSKEKLVG